MRLVLLAVLSLIFTYVGASAYTEIRLIRLLKSKASEQDAPRIYQGHTFKSQRDMDVFAFEQQRNRFSTWTAVLEEWQALLILAACAGFLGSVVRFIKDSQNKGDKGATDHCLLGLVIGPCLMAVAWVSELLIMEGELRFRPETLAAVCFLAGIFVQESWNYVSNLVARLFLK